MNSINKSQEQLFTNGTVYIDEERKANNIVVKSGKVSAIGVDPEKYQNATIIDLKGAIAYPGFCDSHVHIVEVGIANGGIDLLNCATADEIAKKIAETINNIPKGGLIIGLGFYPNDYLTWSLDDLAKIDKVTGERPVVLIDSLGHNCIINSASIAISKLTSETPIPIGGKVVLQNGKPTGMLCESAMAVACNILFPLINDDLIKKGAEKTLAQWSSFGYTSIVDLMGAPFGRLLKTNICRVMEKENTLPVRINYMYTFASLDEIDGSLSLKDSDTEMVKYGGLKLFVDGAFAAGQAWTKDKNLVGNHGLYYVYTDDSYGKQYNLNRIVEKVNDIGHNIHYHVQGDYAIDAVLNALDAAKAKKGKLTSIHTLIHIAFPTNEQIERIKNFNGSVVATVQPGFWEIEGETTKYYGNKANKCYPIKKIIDAGISTGMSTDFSVSPIELAAPSTIMGIAMTGAGDPDNHPPLTMKSLIKGFTVGSAATTNDEGNYGKLDIGYNADIVVYNKDLYTIAKDKLNKDNPKVISTWISGRKIYQSQ
ncbi:MAG: amidohydrolase [Bacteroidetes bacterium]|nr:amidohydrolase [Bacteroidota bacterium]